VAAAEIAQLDRPAARLDLDRGGIGERPVGRIELDLVELGGQLRERRDQPLPRAFAVRQLGEFREIEALARLVDGGVLGIDAAVLRTPYRADEAMEPLTRALAQLRGELD